MSYTLAYLLLGLLWIAASAGGGAMLAFLAKRMHPSLSYRRLWLFYSVLLGASAAILFAVAIL